MGDNLLFVMILSMGCFAYGLAVGICIAKRKQENAKDE